jgi:hypothetical protein
MLGLMVVVVVASILLLVPIAFYLGWILGTQYLFRNEFPIERPPKV